MPKDSDPILILLRLLELAHLSEADRERKYHIGEEEFQDFCEELEDRLRREGYLLE